MDDEAILLKITRQFSKEESVQALLKIISDVRIENGKLQSEAAELKNKIESKKNEPEKIKEKPAGEAKTKKQWEKEEMFAFYEDQMKHQAERIKKQQKEIIELQNKYYSLLASTNKKA